MQDGGVRSRNGREVRTPAKFADVGGLGAAAGPGVSVYQPRLHGISGESPSAKTVAASTAAPAAATTVHGAADSGATTWTVVAAAGAPVLAATVFADGLAPDPGQSWLIHRESWSCGSA